MGNAYNCGIDLIRTTWDVATGGMPPGIYDQCTVTLRDTLPMSSGSVECFFRPSSEYGNQWYASVGVFNTGGRLPASATLNGHGGAFNGDSAYFDFNGYVGPHEGSSTPLGDVHRRHLYVCALRLVRVGWSGLHLVLVSQGLTI